MGYSDSLTIIGSICVVLLLLLAVFFATVRSTLVLANRLFAAFLLLTAIDLSGWISWSVESGPAANGPTASLSATVSLLRLALTLLQMPVLLLYVTSVCFSDFRLRSVHLWHAVPFAIALVFPGALHAAWPAAGWQPQLLAFQAGFNVQFYLYIAAAFLQLRRYRSIFRYNFADASSHTFAWLFQLCLASTLAHTLVLGKGLAGLATSPLTPALNLLVSLTGLAIIVWFAAKALYQPDLFRRVEARDQTPSESDRVVDAVSQADLDHLSAHMQAKAPFLDAGLSLRQLARQMSMPARDLSVLINSGLGQSFFEFVNAYRIDRAAEILRDPGRSDMSVLDVLYEVGFNSKSSFNTAFKRRIGQTPSAYRRARIK